LGARLIPSGEHANLGAPPAPYGASRKATLQPRRGSNVPFPFSVPALFLSFSFHDAGCFFPEKTGDIIEVGVQLAQHRALRGPRRVVGAPRNAVPVGMAPSQRASD
jgi:hypothetical protein